jgi:hypothetical protein
MTKPMKPETIARRIRKTIAKANGTKPYADSKGTIRYPTPSADQVAKFTR